MFFSVSTPLKERERQRKCNKENCFKKCRAKGVIIFFCFTLTKMVSFYCLRSFSPLHPLWWWDGCHFSSQWTRVSLSMDAVPSDRLTASVYHQWRASVFLPRQMPIHQINRRHAVALSKRRQIPCPLSWFTHYLLYCWWFRGICLWFDTNSGLSNPSKDGIRSVNSIYWRIWCVESVKEVTSVKTTYVICQYIWQDPSTRSAKSLEWHLSTQRMLSSGGGSLPAALFLLRFYLQLSERHFVCCGIFQR